jgi:geranylgeranyl transferase type-2 subunit beta
MNDLPYLLRLSTRLLGGLEKLAPERRQVHRDFILAQQMPDGGFRGREGDSDLYYTGFAVRSLAVLGTLTAQDCQRIAGYLVRESSRSVTVIDLVSWLYSALVVQGAGGPTIVDENDDKWCDRLAEMLESFRTKDGGYAKTHEGSAGSTYHSFLVALCYELIGKPVPQPKRLIQFLYDRQRDDGGFVEIAPMKRSGTNPTAAAVSLLGMLGGMDDEIRADVEDFLKVVRSGDGGFLANTRIPFADGLSTFTGLLTVLDLGLDHLINKDQMAAFVRELEFRTGGFRGAVWDEQPDVEYTFYGLGILGLLESIGSSRG